MSMTTIFHLDWINKKREQSKIEIKVNLWVIGAFIAGIFVGKYFL